MKLMAGLQGVLKFHSLALPYLFQFYSSIVIR
jgi:hypothetical protein